MSNDTLDTTDALDVLRHAGESLDEIEDHATRLAASGDVAALAVLLVELRGLRQALGHRERAVEDLLAATMPDKTAEIAGVGVVERRRGTTYRQWDSAELLRQVVRCDLDPDGTGALPSASEVLETVTGTVLACLPVTPSVSWRIGALRARDIDPDEWCTSERARTTIQVHAPAVAA